MQCRTRREFMEVIGFGGFALPKWLWIENSKIKKERKEKFEDHSFKFPGRSELAASHQNRG